jgi:PKHD-type hydroxylase
MMFKEIDLLTRSQVEALRQLAAATPFVDGRITNPHNVAKNNLQLHDAGAYQQSSQLMLQAMMAHEDFRNFAFPAAIAPPMMTRYQPNMRYGEHSDAAILMLPAGPLRSDLSCTIFLSDPASYEGGALRVTLGTREVSFLHSEPDPRQQTQGDTLRRQ